jgi:hypothetical protein
MEKIIHEMNAFLVHTAEVREFYRSQMNKLVIGSPEHIEIENRYIEFLNKSRLTHNEYNHKLANLMDIDLSEFEEQDND